MNMHGIKHAAIGMSLVMASAAAQAVEWTITDLGTLGGSSSQATAINNRGQVVGTSSLAGDISSHAFIYTNGGLYDLGTLGGASSSAAAINTQGQVVGTSGLNGTVESRGFIYSAGKLQSIGALISGVRSSSEARAINNRAQVVGIGSNLDVPQAPRERLYAVAYDRGALRPLNNDMLAATGINDRGQIIGYKQVFDGLPFRARAILLDNGKLTELGTLDAVPGRASIPAGINNAGEIVGTSSNLLTGFSQAFTYRNGKMANLGAQLGYATSEGKAINNFGDVVGAGTRPGKEGSQPFVYSKSGLTELNTLPAVLSAGWVLSEATGINDVGQIVGSGYKNGQQRAYLLTPSR
ncbi:hypothetical protein [Janthinobacterium sp. 17J80-10]|uniref:hypothetical protein n=1 Tax=Janthinobacterium sp. 17J80-10 TaxID=2497863 RepID=UPI0013E8DF1B|nr:hypothetical protein [Janthinobacterium sp. 17J80-10]